MSHNPGKTLDESFSTACGREISSDAIRGSSPPGDWPQGLSGTTVCYECAKAAEAREVRIE